MSVLSLWMSNSSNSSMFTCCFENKENALISEQHGSNDGTGAKSSPFQTIPFALSKAIQLQSLNVSILLAPEIFSLGTAVVSCPQTLNKTLFLQSEQPLFPATLCIDLHVTSCQVYFKNIQTNQACFNSSDSSRPLQWTFFYGSISMNSLLASDVTLAFTAVAANVHLQNSRFTRTKSVSSVIPQLLLQGSVLTLSEVYVSNANFTDGVGPLIVFDGVWDVRLMDVYMKNLSADSSLLFLKSNTATLHKVYAKFNTIQKSLIELQAAMTTIDDSVFIGNQFSRSALSVLPGAQLQVNNSQFFRNTCKSARLCAPVILHEQALAEFLHASFSCSPFDDVQVSLKRIPFVALLGTAETGATSQSQTKSNDSNDDDESPLTLLPLPSCGGDTFDPGEDSGLIDSCLALFMNTSITSECHTVCAAGSYSDLLACRQCPPGYYSPATSNETSCLACAPGSYAAVSGSQHCDPCLAGTAANGRASTYCDSCHNAIITSNAGSTACDQLTTFGLVLAIVSSLLVCVPLLVVLYTQRTILRTAQRDQSDRVKRALGTLPSEISSTPASPRTRSSSTALLLGGQSELKML
eukprot:m.204641 g.204641  ORF g.204641 m.204641 type:complete len:581 (+) comp26036_c2_seq2:646-2388(+)